MRYLDSYRFAFQSPNWMMNILCGAVCFLIPAVGPLILMGYLLEVVEWLHAKKKGGDTSEAGYPDFNFNRFGEYLQRGIWPFLVTLVVSVPISLFIMILWMVLMMGVAAAIGSSVVTVIIFLLLMVLYFAAIVGMNIIQVPLYLRAGMTRDFAQGFSLAFVKDFVRRTKAELLWSAAFLISSGSALVTVGALAFCIGMYPAVALYMFAFNHQVEQLYELYLQRGGEPIPLPAPAASAS